MTIEEIFSPDKIYITIAIVSTLALLFVSILIGVATRRRQRQLLNNCRYRPRKRLMEGSERRCFQLLIQLFGDKFYIIPDVAVSSLLNHKVGTQDRHAAYSFIEDKTVDFVLCNKRTLRPICAIKLSDHHRALNNRAIASVKNKNLPKNIPGNRPEDLQKFFKSAHIPFVYLPKADISADIIIEEFSRVIYETSTIKGRKSS